MTQAEIFSILKARPAESNKGDFGFLNIVAGSLYYRGAACLAVSAALRSGCGVVCLASTETVTASAAAKLNECTYFPLPENANGSISEKCTEALLVKINSGSCCLIGCGMVNCADTAFIAVTLIRGAQCPMILDADALNSISNNTSVLRSAKSIPIITPHIGEMARLCGKTIAEIKAEPDKIATAVSDRLHCVTVLKDHITRVAAPDGRVYVNNTGNAGLAKGGSGDVLAGIISSFAAQGYDPYDAAVCGVYLHGLAADRCAARLSQYGMLPSDILFDLCSIFAENGR